MKTKKVIGVLCTLGAFFSLAVINPSNNIFEHKKAQTQNDILITISQCFFMT